MSHAPRADLSQAFCSYCGYPPVGLSRASAHRVCMRCEMGVVLQAPAGLGPRYDDPFVIVNRQLAVQAVSRHAEVALSIDEPAGVDAPLEDFLICKNGDRERGALTALVELAFAGAESSKKLELRAVANPELQLQGRVTSCGPPPGALLVLTPLVVRATASRKRRPASGRSLTSVGGPTSGSAA
jgi:hypothetical protein